MIVIDAYIYEYHILTYRVVRDTVRGWDLTARGRGVCADIVVTRQSLVADASVCGAAVGGGRARSAGWTENRGRVGAWPGLAECE